MADERSRELERRWRESGSTEDWTAWLRERMRSGEISERVARELQERRARQTATADKEERARALVLVGRSVFQGTRSLASAAEELGLPIPRFRSRYSALARGWASERVPEAVVDLLLDPAQRDRLLVDLKRERESGALWLTNRLSETLRNCSVSEDQIRCLFEALGEEELLELGLGTLVMREEFPVDLLEQLIAEDRFVTEIGHRTGPRDVLEAVLPRYPSSEPVRTLILRYYCDADYPLEALLQFIRDHRGQLTLRFLQDLPEPRQQAAIDAFLETNP